MQPKQLPQRPHLRVVAWNDEARKVFGWRCPVCNSTAYRQTLVARPNGTAYLTEFFECAG